MKSSIKVCLSFLDEEERPETLWTTGSGGSRKLAADKRGACRYARNGSLNGPLRDAVGRCSRRPALTRKSTSPPLHQNNFTPVNNASLSPRPRPRHLSEGVGFEKVPSVCQGSMHALPDRSGF